MKKPLIILGLGLFFVYIALNSIAGDEVAFIGCILLFFIFGPMVAVWWGARRTRLDLEDRMANLEARLGALQKLTDRVTTLETSAPVAAPPIIQVYPPPREAPVPSPVVIQQPPPVRPAAPSVPDFRSESMTHAPVPEPAAASAPPPEQSVPPSFTMLGSEPQTATPASSGFQDVTSRLRSLLDIEELLGTNWLSKLGIGILVLGVAFFLAWQMVELGPLGKVMVGWVTGAALLGAGIYFERSDVYRLLARAAVAGGWAVLFFTAYAMYHVPAARVLQSPLLSLVVMLAVAVPMVAHTLRYRSQVVTGLAFLLAFATITLNRADVWSLLAGAVLAAGLAFIAWRMQWFELEVFGMLATYLNHWYWLRPIIEPMQVRHEFPEFRASGAILVICWMIFRASYILRKPDDERVSTVAGLLNPFLLMGVLKYQSVYPHMAFWFLLALGAIELAIGQLPITRRRRTAFVLQTALGAALLFAAFPFRYSAQNVAVIWLVEAQLLLVAGILLREVVFRRLALISTAPIFVVLTSYYAARVFGARMDGGRVVFEAALGSVLLLAALLWYATAHWVPRRWPDLFSAIPEQKATRYLTYAAGTILLIGAWVIFPKHWSATSWMALAVALAYIGRRLELRDLSLQATVIAGCALLRVLFLNLPATDTLHVAGLPISARLISVTLVAAGFYFVSRWTQVAEWSLTRHLPSAFTWTGSLLVGLLLWYELLPASVALGWALLGVALFETGARRGNAQLRLQAYLVFVFVFFRMLFVNLNASDVPGWLDPRLYTVAPLAIAFYYVYGRIRKLVASV